MESADLFLLEPGMPLPDGTILTGDPEFSHPRHDAGPVPNFGQGNRPDLYCPEISIREAMDFSSFWQYAGSLDQEYRNEIPYWCIVWPGSRMLARFALDTNLELRNRRVLELGC